MVSADIDVKTLVGWPMTFASQVPFPGKEGLVVILLERLGNGHLFVRKIIAILWMQHQVGGAVALAGNPVGDIHAHGMPTGHDARPRGTAHRAGGVTLGKAHAAGRQPVYIGCLVKFAAIGPNIRPAHVIDQEEQEISLLGSLRIQETTEGTKKNKGTKQGAHAHEDTLQARRWQWRVN